MAQLFITITFPPGVPTVDRTFQLRGNISFSTPANWTQHQQEHERAVRAGRPAGRGQHSPAATTGSAPVPSVPSTPWGSFVQLTLNANAVFQVLPGPASLSSTTLNVSTTFMVRLLPPIAPTIGLAPFTSPIVASQVPRRLHVHRIGDKSAGADRGRAIQGRRRPVRERGQRQRQLVAVQHPAAVAADRRRSRSRAHHSRDRHVRNRRRDLEVLRRSPAAANRRSARQRHDLHRRADHVVDHELDAARAAVLQRGHRDQLQRSRIRPAVDADAPMADGGVSGRGCRHADSGPRPRHDRDTVPAILGRAAETFGLTGAGSNCRTGLQSGCRHRWRCSSSAGACARTTRRMPAC